jgi:Glycosyltransferase 61
VKKPRLLIIGRKHTRALTNTDQVISMAKELGFEVVVDDLNRGPNLQEAAQVVNTFDVMMGVHGAGLTNIIFLPMNAVVIQIIPLGKLNQLFSDEFGVPARDMNLKHLKYEILEDESTLIDLYPRDDPIFTDPMSIHKKGWLELNRIYLRQKNVKLDVVRFRSVLEKAMHFLRP